MKRGGPSNDWGIEYIDSTKQPDASTSSAGGGLASSATGGGYAESDQKTSVVTAPNATFGCDKFAFGDHVL